MKKLTVIDALKKYGSTAIIGNVEERFELRKARYQYQVIPEDDEWRAFYDGWIEGRFGMFGELHEAATPDVRPSRWADFKDSVKTAGSCTKSFIYEGLRLHQAQLREEVVMFWKVEVVLILMFLAFVAGAVVMATFGIQGRCYFP